MKSLEKFYRTDNETPPKLGNGSVLIAVAPPKLPPKKETRTQRVFREFPGVN